MSVDDIQRKLEGGGLAFVGRDRLGNDTGYQLRFKTGEIVNIQECPPMSKLKRWEVVGRVGA